MSNALLSSIMSSTILFPFAYVCLLMFSNVRFLNMEENSFAAVNTKKNKKKNKKNRKPFYTTERLFYTQSLNPYN